MGENDQLTGPTIVSDDDGWTLASGSSDRPSEAQLAEALGETPPAPAEPPAELPADEVTEEEGAEEEVAAAPPAETPLQKKPRRPHDPQKRIDKITADLAAERERTNTLERQLQELRVRPPVPRLEPPPAPIAPPAPAIGPKPAWGGEAGFEAQGRSWEEYETASQEWTQETLKAEMRTAIDERLGQERARVISGQQQAAQDAAFAARIDALRAKRPDYDEVIERLGDLESPVLRHLIYHSQDGPAIGLHLAEHVEQARVLAQTPFSRPLVDAIQRSHAPVKVLEHFAKNPKEIMTYLRLDPISAIVSIGRLEQRLNVAPSVTTGAARSVTSARPPLRTVGGGAPMTRTSSSPPASDVPFGPDYIQQENQSEAMLRDRRRGF